MEAYGGFIRLVLFLWVLFLWLIHMNIAYTRPKTLVLVIDYGATCGNSAGTGWALSFKFMAVLNPPREKGK